MTAHALATTPRIRNHRAARAATQRRIVAQQRSRYAAVRKVTLCIAGVMLVLLAEVLLSANITALSYSVDRAHARRAAMELQTARLDDRIDALTSDDRLAAVAAKLGMVQPHQFVRVSLEAPHDQANPLAFLPIR